jgi:hypothetical protein
MQLWRLLWCLSSQAKVGTVLGSIMCELSFIAKSSTDLTMELFNANKFAAILNRLVNLESKKNILIYLPGFCGALRKNLDLS